MWYVMAKTQHSYDLSERLVRAITNWQTTAVHVQDDVEALLERGADVNQSHGLLLPLHSACMVSDPDCVEMLLQRGAQVNGIDGYGRAALHYAAERDAACVALLLANGADPDIPDRNQDTPLHWACFKNQAQCVKQLLQVGAQIDARDYNDDTPLSWAAMKGNLESIEVLLEYNATVNTENYRGSTPLQRVALILSSGLDTDKDNASMELLLKATGQLNIREDDGQLPQWLTRDNKMCDMLSPYCQRPRRLQELCRYAVRRYLGKRFLPNATPELPIPSPLQEFLLLHR